MGGRHGRAGPFECLDRVPVDLQRRNHGAS